MLQEKIDKLFVLFDYKTSLEHFDKIKFNSDTAESTFTSLHITSDDFENSHGPQSELQLMSPLPKDKFIFYGELRLGEGHSTLKNLRVCLDNAAESFMIAKESLGLSQKLREIVCGSGSECSHNQDLLNNMGEIELVLSTLDRQPGSKSTSLKIKLQDIVRRGEEGRLVWNLKEYTDYLSQKEFTQTSNSKIAEPPVFTKADLQQVSEDHDELSEDSELTKSASRTDLNSSLRSSKKNQSSDQSQGQEVDYSKPKYDFREPMEKILTMKNSWHTKELLWKETKHSCDVLLGTRFLFKFNLVFKLVKTNEYPPIFQVSMGFMENRKYIQNWQIGLFYLMVSVLLAVLIILFLKQSPKIGELKRGKKGKVKVD